MNTWKDEHYGKSIIRLTKHAVQRAKECQLEPTELLQKIVESQKDEYGVRHNPKFNATKDQVYINGTIQFVGQVRPDKYTGAPVFIVITVMDTRATLKKFR